MAFVERIPYVERVFLETFGDGVRGKDSIRGESEVQNNEFMADDQDTLETYCRQLWVDNS